MLKFGTDGVRGVANQELTPELALALGRASARVMGPRQVVIGRDTRRSGPMLEAALAAGYASEGVDVVLLGVVPTPAVARTSQRLDVCGAMISASHNPFPDNGIKLFAAGGLKLSDEAEAELEHELARILAGGTGDRPTGVRVGVVTPADGSDLADYSASMSAAIEGRSLRGLSIILDCAHGAGSVVAPETLAALGAHVTVVHAEPDGVNINERAGSTSPGALQAAVVAAAADVGLALDGDADRLLAVDSNGSIIDGDQVIGVLAVDRLARGRLPNEAVVVTVMSNLGFRQGMARHGITVIDTKVGDRYVLEGLLSSGAVLGGEQSGHVIQADLATTGDGLLTAVTLLDVMARTGRGLGDLAADAMTVLPQVLVNVRLGERDPGLVDRVADAVTAAEGELGDEGRVLLRASGTEPLIRVMVEAPTEARAQDLADRLADAVRAASA